MAPCFILQSPASLITGLDRQGVSQARHGFRDLRSSFRPERIAQPGHRDAHRHPRRQPLGCVGEQGSRGGQQSHDGKQTGRPAGQDSGSERCDAKYQAAEHIQDPYERIGRYEGADVHRAGSAIDDPQVALHKFRRRGRQHRQDKGFDEDKARLSAQERLNRRKPARPSQPDSSTCRA